MVDTAHEFIFEQRTPPMVAYTKVLAKLAGTSGHAIGLEGARTIIALAVYDYQIRMKIFGDIIYLVARKDSSDDAPTPLIASNKSCQLRARNHFRAKLVENIARDADEYTTMGAPSRPLVELARRYYEAEAPLDGTWIATDRICGCWDMVESQHNCQNNILDLVGIILAGMQPEMGSEFR
jgi:hypothetical protein